MTQAKEFENRNRTHSPHNVVGDGEPPIPIIQGPNRAWNPLWLWAVFGVIVVCALIVGLLFGGDGNYT